MRFGPRLSRRGTATCVGAEARGVVSEGARRHSGRARDGVAVRVRCEAKRNDVESQMMDSVERYRS
jgi:hypothetical protein